MSIIHLDTELIDPFEKRPIGEELTIKITDVMTVIRNNSITATMEYLQAKLDLAKPMTVGVICKAALLRNNRPSEQQKPPSQEDKVKRFDLALRIGENKKVDLEHREIVIIQNLIGMDYGPLVVGVMQKHLEDKGDGVTESTRKGSKK